MVWAMLAGRWLTCLAMDGKCITRTQPTARIMQQDFYPLGLISYLAFHLV